MYPISGYRDNNYYYKQFFTLKELLGENMDDVIYYAVNMFATLDNCNTQDQTKIRAQLQIIFGELKDNPPDKIFSRYGKWEFDYDEGEYKVIPVSRYVSNLGKKLYQAFLPLYQQKQFFNASMDWEDISDLLKEERTDKGNTTLTGKNTNNRTLQNTNNSEVGNYLNGQTEQAFEYAPTYASDGSKGTTTDTGTIGDNGTIDNTGTTQHTSTIQNLKLDYLKQLYETIEKQKYSLTDAFYEFVNFIVIPNQNIYFEVFPWPWVFTGGDNL